MSKKSQILSLLDEGKDYDEIQTTVEGSTRAYIRTIASGYRKDAKKDKLPEENNEPEKEPEIESGGMEFDNDLNNGEHEMTNELKTGDKTGAEYHKEWVKAGAYECDCGCTLNRKSTYCPNCGVTLDWKGF